MEHNNEKITFFLFKNRNLIKLIDKFNCIIEIYESLLYKDYSSIESQNYIDNINFYTREKLLTQEKIDNYSEILNECCCHQFIEDIIDSGLDNSTYIKYCIICECYEN